MEALFSSSTQSSLGEYFRNFVAIRTKDECICPVERKLNTQHNKNNNGKKKKCEYGHTYTLSHSVEVQTKR